MTLLRKGYEVNTGVLHNSEVDFVATSSYRTLYVQVAYGIEDRPTTEREYGVFKGIRREGEKLLVTMDDDRFPMRDGVRHISAWNLGELL